MLTMGVVSSILLPLAILGVNYLPDGALGYLDLLTCNHPKAVVILF